MQIGEHMLLIIFCVIFVIYLLLVVFSGRFLHVIAKLATKEPSLDLIKNLKSEQVKFKGSSGNNLYGWFVHSQIEPTGTIIIVPGWWHTRATVIPHINFYTEHGYNVFVYDQRSHGESDIAPLTFGRLEGEDFVCAIDYLLTYPGVDKGSLVVLGESLGSAAVIFGAPKRKIFKCIIIEGPYAGSKCMGLHLFQNRVGKIGAFFLVPGWWIGSRLWCDGRPGNGYPSNYIHLLAPIPIFFIRGKNDHMVPEDCAFKLINNASEPKQVWITEKSGHRKALQTYPEEYKKRTLEFIHSYLKPHQEL